MVFATTLLGAAVVLSGLAAAAPRPGSSDSSSYGSSDSSYGGDSSSYGGDSNNYDGGNSNYNGGSSNYGGDSSNYDGGNSNYDGGNSNYDGGNSNYDGGNSYNGGYNNYDSSSSDYYKQTTEVKETSTSSTYESKYTQPSYGSGSNYWGGSGYEDCVNQCIAQYGGNDAGGYYQATATSGEMGSKGTGATHTVLVAPTKGVFRMMPFAVNASVGDVIEFHWGADQHTVTKSSALTPCNKSNADPVFQSGEQDQSFVFTQVVNDTQPTFYFCGTATHCEKGMFGIINPAIAAPGAPTSLSGMMNNMAATDSDLAAYAAYASNLTANNNAASSWGAQFDMKDIPDWAQGLFATNVMYTRATIAMNSEIIKPDNSIDLSSVSSTPLMIPQDLSGVLNAATAASSGSTDPVAAAAAAASSDASTPASAPTSTPTGGAGALASPKMLIAAFALVATFFAL